MMIPAASHPATNQIIYNILEPRVQAGVRILDFGAGRGHMCQRLGELAKSRGMVAGDCLEAGEITPESFQYADVHCARLNVDSVIPFAEEEFDVVYAIEVLEHTRRPYDFLDEAFRVLKPNGMLVFSVPNVMHILSRLQILFQGFGEMFDAPSKRIENAGRICGHIMPLNYSYFEYGLSVSGFTEISTYTDRRKCSSFLLSLFLYPVLYAGSLFRDRKLRKYDKQVWRENRKIIYKMNSLEMLSARSCIVSAIKPNSEFRLRNERDRYNGVELSETLVTT